MVRVFRGFTLVELMVSLAISGIVFAAASTSVIAVMKTLKRTEKQIQIDIETKILSEYLSSQLRVIGGGALRPWHGIDLEENWNGDGSDRLTVLELAPDLEECVIQTRTGGGAAIHFDAADCCINSSWNSRHLLATTEGGEEWSSLFSTGVNGSSCHLIFPPGHNGLGKSKVVTASTFSGGALIPVRVKRYWLDESTHQLKVDISEPNTNGFETQILADQVYDLQFALGYDVHPADGSVEDLGSDNDEWLGNAAGDAMGVNGLQDAQETDLRMLQVGLIVGGTVGAMSGRAQILNGPERELENGLLRAVGARVYLRNSNLYF